MVQLAGISARTGMYLMNVYSLVKDPNSQQLPLLCLNCIQILEAPSDRDESQAGQFCPLSYSSRAMAVRSALYHLLKRKKHLRRDAFPICISDIFPAPIKHKCFKMQKTVSCFIAQDRPDIIILIQITVFSISPVTRAKT